VRGRRLLSPAHLPPGCAAVSSLSRGLPSAGEAVNPRGARFSGRALLPQPGSRGAAVGFDAVVRVEGRSVSLTGKRRSGAVLK